MPWLENTFQWLSGGLFGSKKRKIEGEKAEEADNNEPARKRVRREQQPPKNGEKKKAAARIASKAKKAVPKKKAPPLAKAPKHTIPSRTARAKPLPMVKGQKLTTAKKALSVIAKKSATKVDQKSKETPKKLASKTSTQKKKPVVSLSPLKHEKPNISSPYSNFGEENFVRMGVFIFSPSCRWLAYFGPTDLSTRGCVFYTQGALPTNVKFALVFGVHPLFPSMSELFALGVVLKNSEGIIVVDFLKVGYIAELRPETRDSLQLQSAGSISTDRLTELWRCANGDIQVPMSVEPATIDLDDFLRVGPMVYHGPYVWSFYRGTMCFAVSSTQERRAYVVAVGHPFARHPTEYAIGVVLKHGRHMSLVQFVRAGLTTSLQAVTLEALGGRVLPDEVYQRVRLDLWNTAAIPMNPAPTVQPIR
jgi:hypothetical protein